MQNSEKSWHIHFQPEQKLVSWKKMGHHLKPNQA